ncbi:S-adenosyl-L-methionine-dependent methyltransferase [Glarea lozoyensis ATCC 20868]|uniref:S-adenosyl-L-methionine-dependent methyltransferase n=1 Tax=Glarea lozoyensis (strain ATCC 20868 / MF5171) TaxID=1116229 RepID=S3CL61_GLAL2|nr:S-adenosyl-L-methionine-dependent methyltransferase [Glarea lozoyensis ATCC 20868]EPE26500.1 S-adenosyl-L-methionine-dependent methyltransferase [Glarea lozoyensis ATCC 20868]
MSVSHSHHHHGHGHGHDHSHNEENNRSHWDQNAASYNTRFSKTIDQIILEIQSRTDWINVEWSESPPSSPENASTTDTSQDLEPKRSVRLLDYACGTGLVSRALAPLITQSIGIDLSSGMAEQYNIVMSNQGIPPSQMRAVVGNLLSPSDPSPATLSDPEFFDFDIAAVGLGFHHFSDPGFAAKQLVARLKVGGVLFIVDFLPHKPIAATMTAEDERENKSEDKGEQTSNAAHTVTHNGFSQDDVKKMFEEAGAGKAFEYLEIGSGIVFHGVKEGGGSMKRSVFFARGEKV